ncbi:cuticle protein 7-like [Pollicipes pollicipes]|uniref:cuticle protein 7-like n=1 Tax=Pollicipes pollicipes TaxID=41117 RepID=UPI00188568AF|nr:cuticle protein 7-like [Pollicipes pollicipes]
MKICVFAALLSVAAAQSYGQAPAPRYAPAKAPPQAPAPAPSHAPAPSYARAPSYASSYQEPRYYAQPHQFAYAVNDHYSGLVFSHNENSDTKVVQGYFSVNLPDGQVQHVKYTADNQGYGGYNAEVTYDGEAQYPEPEK